MKYWIELSDEQGRVISQGWGLNAADTIVKLQETIKLLRRESLPSFDASWGEQPPAILGPSDEELAALINSQRN